MATERAARRCCAALAVLFGLIALLWCDPAFAYHTDEEHLTDDTAYTLDGKNTLGGRKKWRVGLYKVQVGLSERWTLGSYIWPWLLRTPSLQLKWQFYSGQEWHWAAQVGFMRLNTGSFAKDEPNAPIFTVGTAELLTSYRIKRQHQISGNLAMTLVQLKGDVSSDTLEGAGQAGVTNVQYVASYEYRWSERLALVVTGRFLLAQIVAADGNAILRPDAYTTIDVRLEASDDKTLNYENAFSITPALAWSWQTFNLRLGLGYGNLNIPGVNFMLNERVFYPELDLFWTF